MLARMLSVGAVLAAACHGALAADIEVHVVDHGGKPLPEVAVYALGSSSETGAPAQTETAHMDQRDRAFRPHILIVEAGTTIDFPNNDQILHHVYSFSPAKRFELPLYAGSTHEPIRFDEPGLVTLGCNIHDDMLGYILVVDTPHFAMTDGAGIAKLEGLPPGQYQISLWTPRLRPSHLPDAQSATATDDALTKVDFEITDKLFPPHSTSETSLKWSDY